jgi:hypothetical protein
MLLTDFYHRSQNVVPGLLVIHDAVGEHATVPANVPECFGEFAVFITQPIASIMSDIQFTIWV